jgi:hypothetical protein
MSATMYGTTPGAGAGQAIFTDDVSLQVFMEHLKRLVSIQVRIFASSSIMLTYIFITGCWCTNELKFLAVLLSLRPSCFLCLKL